MESLGIDLTGLSKHDRNVIIALQKEEIITKYGEVKSRLRDAEKEKDKAKAKVDACSKSREKKEMEIKEYEKKINELIVKEADKSKPSSSKSKHGEEGASLLPKKGSSSRGNSKGHSKLVEKKKEYENKIETKKAELVKIEASASNAQQVYDKKLSTYNSFLEDKKCVEKVYGYLPKEYRE